MQTRSGQKDLFSVPAVGEGPLVLELKRIQAPRTLAQKKAQKKSAEPKPIEPNFHIPSFKNAKHWITKDPRGNPLKQPFLITSPEFQEWKAKAVLSLESQLLSMCQTGSGETRLEPTKLFAMLSRLPIDDSVNDLPEGSWKVVRVPPGEEGCKIEITRLR